MIVKYQNTYWLCSGARSEGDRPLLQHLITKECVVTDIKKIEIMKTKQQLADVAALLRKHKK